MEASFRTALRPRGFDRASRDIALPLPLPPALLPMAGALVAALLVISRRPDAVTNAQFWAEDGKVFYANVYAHGLLAALPVPVAGYLQELPVLVAGAAQAVPLRWAPLVMNSVAIAVQVLPVGLLLSARARTISTSLAVRSFLAALYIALPGAFEIDANIVNAMWHLAVAALIVLMLAPPACRRWRILDGAILLMSGLTGVFVLVLAPLAFAQRRWRGRTVVPNWMLAALSLCAVIQLAYIAFLSHHVPSGFVGTGRPASALHASPVLLAQILDTRVLVAPFTGDTFALGLLGNPAIWLIAGLGVFAAVSAARSGPPELRLIIGLGAGVFAMALARPLGSGWSSLVHTVPNSRYFVIPELAVVATAVWAAGRGRAPLARAVAALSLVLCCAVVIPHGWSYQSFVRTPFAEQAERFAKAPPGTREVFQLNPAPWRMTLIKRA